MGKFLGILASIAVHHSGYDVFNDLFGSTKTPLDIEKEHITGNKWDDIGYHFLITLMEKYTKEELYILKVVILERQTQIKLE